MSELTVVFEGICTHITEKPQEFGIDVPHRVVLVHAEHGLQEEHHPATSSDDADRRIGNAARGSAHPHRQRGAPKHHL